MKDICKPLSAHKTLAHDPFTFVPDDRLNYSCADVVNRTDSSPRGQAETEVLAQKPLHRQR